MLAEEPALPAEAAAPPSRRQRPPTRHELDSRVYYAEVCKKPPERWQFVREPLPDVWYDYADARSRKYGQCRMGPDGQWQQAPRTPYPVILAWIPLQRGS